MTEFRCGWETRVPFIPAHLANIAKSTVKHKNSVIMPHWGPPDLLFVFLMDRRNDILVFMLIIVYDTDVTHSHMFIFAVCMTFFLYYPVKIRL